MCDDGALSAVTTMGCLRAAHLLLGNVTKMWAYFECWCQISYICHAIHQKRTAARHRNHIPVCQERHYAYSGVKSGRTHFNPFTAHLIAAVYTVPVCEGAVRHGIFCFYLKE